MDANVQFNESEIARAEPETPPIISFIIKHSYGLIKTQSQALYLILGFLGTTILLSLFFIFSAGKSKPKPEPDIFDRPQQSMPEKLK